MGSGGKGRGLVLADPIRAHVAGDMGRGGAGGGYLSPNL